MTLKQFLANSWGVIVILIWVAVCIYSVAWKHTELHWYVIVGVAAVIAVIASVITIVRRRKATGEAKPQ